MPASFRLLVDELTHGTVHRYNIVNALSLSSFKNLLMSQSVCKDRLNKLNLILMI